MSYPFMIIRLWPHHHTCEADLGELLAALKRNPKACDEVWFCTELGFPPLAAHADSARLMAAAAAEIRKLGIEPGLQIANTLGHGLSLLNDNSGAAWPPMIGADGETGAPCPCPRAPEALAYMDRLARDYAAWQPSSVWIDDDLRMNFHGAVKYACFCSRCVQSFSGGAGKDYGREQLVRLLNSSDQGDLRLAWSNFNALSLAGIAGVISKAVHEVAPTCRMGLQQIGHEWFMYNGADWNPMLEQMAAVTGFPSRARLGHGYYTDHAPRQLIEKTSMIARQVSRLAPCVDQICAEIDSFTHNAFGKSAQGVAVESALDLAMGCNSISYAVLCSGHEPMVWYETLLNKLSAWRPFLENYANLNAGTVPGGVSVCLGMEHVTRRLQPDEKPFAWGSIDLNPVYSLACLGLPLCMSKEDTGVTLLHAEVVGGLSDGYLRKLFSGGVMLDGLAAMRIQARGLGELLGVRVIAVEGPDPCNERITGDPLNGNYAGMKWDAFPNASGFYMLEADSREARVLGQYEDVHGVTRGMATVLTENPSGGRVALFGYYGWESAPSGAKRNQYLMAADWIARGRLPVIQQATAQVLVVPRVDAEGRLVSVFLLNTSIDKTPPLELRLRGVDATRARWLVPEEAGCDLVLIEEGADKLCRTPPLAPWSVACVAGLIAPM